jgi:hypothetical protein
MDGDNSVAELVPKNKMARFEFWQYHGDFRRAHACGATSFMTPACRGWRRHCDVRRCDALQIAI